MTKQETDERIIKKIRGVLETTSSIKSEAPGELRRLIEIENQLLGQVPKIKTRDDEIGKKEILKLIQRAIETISPIPKTKGLTRAENQLLTIKLELKRLILNKEEILMV